MDIHYTHIIYLCQELPYMLVRSFVIVLIELCDVRHPKPTWIRDRIIVLGVGLLIGSGTSLGCEAKLPQCPSDLVSNPLSHHHLVYPASSCLVRGVTQSPGK
jgi:hypothetical protein